MKFPTKPEAKLFRVYIINNELVKLNLIDINEMVFRPSRGYFWSKKSKAEVYLGRALDMGMNASIEEITQEEWIAEARKGHVAEEVKAEIPVVKEVAQKEAEPAPIVNTHGKRDEKGRFVKKSA